MHNLINICQSTLEPYFGYCSIVWNGLTDSKADKPKPNGARIIMGVEYMALAKGVLSKLG